jgi:ABC-type antimicrobial peptide transport system permease subunit
MFLDLLAGPGVQSSQGIQFKCVVEIVHWLLSLAPRDYREISYSVSRRLREIGIRTALGARPQEVARLFAARGFVLALIGVGCGLAGAVALTRLLVSLLFNVSPLDPLTYTAASLGLLIAAVFATFMPTLRAMGIDPIEALRVE